MVTANGKTWEGVVENFSQQGARIECDGLFAIGQPVQLAGGEGAKALADMGIEPSSLSQSGGRA